VPPLLVDGNKVGQLTKNNEKQKKMMNQESRKKGLTARNLGIAALLCSALISLSFAGCCAETKPAPPPAVGKQPVGK
jgi:hypothetical protein